MWVWWWVRELILRVTENNKYPYVSIWNQNKIKDKLAMKNISYYSIYCVKCVLQILNTHVTVITLGVQQGFIKVYLL